MVQEYKHLLPKEVEIWERFLACYGSQFDSFEYDLHLGPGAPVPEDAPDWMRRQMEAVSRDRVDVVAHTPGGVWIIEIKPRGGKGAIGQLLQYKAEYLEEMEPARPVFMILLCERLAPRVRETCAEQGISIYLV